MFVIVYALESLRRIQDKLVTVVTTRDYDGDTGARGENFFTCYIFVHFLSNGKISLIK